MARHLKTGDDLFDSAAVQWADRIMRRTDNVFGMLTLLRSQNDLGRIPQIADRDPSRQPDSRPHSLDRLPQIFKLTTQADNDNSICFGDIWG